MPEVILTLNASQYNKDLSAAMKITEDKAKEASSAVVKAAAKAGDAGSNAAKKIKQESQNTGNSLKNVFEDLKESLSDKNFIKKFLSAEIAFDFIKKGIDLCITMAKDLWDSWTQSAEELQQIAEAQKDILETETRINEKRRSESMSYLEKLKSLCAQEKLSNDQRREMIQIIDILNGRYRNLNLSVEMLTGSMVQFEKAQARILRHEAAKKKHMLSQEAGILRSENYAQAEVAFENSTNMTQAFFEKYSKKGIKIQNMLSGSYFGDHDKHLDFLRNWLANATGEKEIDAVKKIIQNVQRIQEIDKEFASLHFTGYSSEAEAANAASQKNMFYHQEDSALDIRQNFALSTEEQLKEQQALAKMTPAQKIKYYKKKLAAAQDQYDSLIPDYNEKLAEWNSAKKYGSRAQQLDAKRALVPLEEQRVKLLQEQYRYLEAIAQIQRDIDEARKKADADAAAEAQKKADAEKAAAEAKAKQLRSARQGILGKAQSLLERTGDKREGAYASTLRDFESKKGESATDQEKELIRKLADLTVSIGEKTNLKFSEIQTNSLTARGGFQSGAVVTDKDAINRQIEKNTQREAALSEDLRNLVKRITDLLEV